MTSSTSIVHLIMFRYFILGSHPACEIFFSSEVFWNYGTFNKCLLQLNSSVTTFPLIHPVLHCPEAITLQQPLGRRFVHMLSPVQPTHAAERKLSLLIYNCYQFQRKKASKGITSAKELGVLIQSWNFKFVDTITIHEIHKSAIIHKILVSTNLKLPIYIPC